jgi:hypothetical protein
VTGPCSARRHHANTKRQLHRKTGHSLQPPPIKQTKRQPGPLSFPASTCIPFDTGQRISPDPVSLSPPTRRLHDQSFTTRARGYPQPVTLVNSARAPTRCRYPSICWQTCVLKGPDLPGSSSTATLPPEGLDEACHARSLCAGCPPSETRQRRPVPRSPLSGFIASCGGSEPPPARSVE